MRAGAGSRTGGGGSSHGGSLHGADAFQAAAAKQPARGGGSGAGVLHADSYAHPPQGTKEVVSDLGHKAAKALQSGTKWFMKASKTLVSQVQHKLDQGQAGGHHGAASSRAGEGAPAAVIPMLSLLCCPAL